MRSRHRSLVALVGLAVVAGACGSDSSTGPAPGVQANLSQAFSELEHPAVSDAMVGLAGIFVPPGSSSGCTYTAASQSFVCPALNESGISIAFSYALIDASGAAQSAFGPTTTNSVRATSVVSGTTTELGAPLTIEGRQDLTISGLLSTTHTLNGTSSFHLSGTVLSGTGGTPVAVGIVSKTTFTNLVLPSTAGAWPASGSILLEETLDGVSGTDRIQLTFNGTSKLALVFTASSGRVSHCTMDLGKGAEVNCVD
jgi:hypothetical protein